MRLLDPGMDPLSSQIDPYRIGRGRLKPVISLFSQNVDSGRRQHSIFRAENWPPRVRDRGEISYLTSPLCAPLQFSRTAFYFAPDKRPENIPDPEEVISDKQRLHIHTESTFRPAKVKDAHICREILMTQMTSSVGGGFSNVRTLEANGAPPEAFRDLYADHFGFLAADADRDLFEARKEDY